MSHFIRLFLVEFSLVLLEMAGWQEIGEYIRNQHSGNLTFNFGKILQMPKGVQCMAGYLGNEYSGKLKFNVGRNSSNARGSSSGIICFAPYAPQSLTPNCLQSWSEGLEIKSQRIWNLTLAKTVPMPRGAPVLLLILPQSSAPCSVQSQLKLTVMKYKLYNWNSRENEQWLNDTIWILCPKMIVALNECCNIFCPPFLLSLLLYSLPCTNMSFVP